MPRSTPAPPPSEPLTDGVVVVRARELSDLDTIVAASRDPETRRWLDDRPLDPVVDAPARTAALARVEETWRSGRATPLVVADAGTGEPVGLLNLQFRDDESASIAYSVFPAHRGHGVAGRAVGLVVPWARSLGVTNLVLEIDEANGASISVARGCGFVWHGELAEPDGAGDGGPKLVFRHPGSRGSEQ